MAKEGEKSPLPLIAIHINLEQPSVVFVAADLSATRLTYSPRGILYEVVDKPSENVSEPSDSVDIPKIPVQRTVLLPGDQTTAPKERQEKEPTITLPGKLASQPKEGRPDNHGKPTAWARLLAHDEEADQAMMLSATFHNHTRAIALGLA